MVDWDLKLKKKTKQTGFKVSQDIVGKVCVAEELYNN